MIFGGLLSLPVTIVPLAMQASGAPPLFRTAVTLLLVIPGAIFALGCCMSMPLIVDREMDTLDAMKESWRITSGRRVDIFVTMLVIFGGILAGCCLCGVGVPVVMAVTPIAFSYIYLRLTGQPVAATPS